MDKSDKPTTIEVVTIDSILKYKENISCIKVDTKGVDYDILKGVFKTSKKHKPVIIFEVNEGDSKRSVGREVLDYLKLLDYDIRKINFSNCVTLPDGDITPEQEAWIETVKEIYSNSKRWGY
jgi:hypothetical protein